MARDIQEREKRALASICDSDLFSNFRQTEKDSIIAVSEITRVRKGGLLFSPGEKAEHFYFLLKGTIRIFKTEKSSGGDEIARFTQGDIIGEFDFARGADYDAFAEAVEDSSLVMFPEFGLSMEKFAMEEPQLNSRILFNSVAMVTERIKATRKLIIESAYWVKELHRKVHEDSSTGLWKQTFITEEINQLLENPMALIMLKPDRFKILVDTLGHDAGDEAMIKIAAILKGITRKLNKGWALRFKSNETGILINKCDAAQAESLARSLAKLISDMPEVTLNKNENFHFTGSISWAIWPLDNKSWDSLFEGTYKSLLETSKGGGNKIVRYVQEKA